MYFTHSNSDPSQLVKYLNKHVKIELDSKAFANLTQERFFFGWVYTIDPVSLTIVLIDETKTKATLVMNDDIKDLTIIDSKTIDLNDLFQTNETESLLVQRDKLVDWLKENRLPVELDSDGSINILNTVYIRPPYSVNNCESTNEIILDKIQNLVSQLINNQK